MAAVTLHQVQLHDVRTEPSVVMSDLLEAEHHLDMTGTSGAPTPLDGQQLPTTTSNGDGPPPRPPRTWNSDSEAGAVETLEILPEDTTTTVTSRSGGQPESDGRRSARQRPRSSGKSSVESDHIWVSWI